MSSEPKYEGTELNQKKGAGEEEVEAWIKEAIAETKKLEKKPAEKQITKEPELSATPIAPAAKPAEPAAPKPIERIPVKESVPAPKAEKPLNYEATFRSYKSGDLVKGKVVKIDPNSVLVDFGYKAEGIIRHEELADKPPANIEDILKIGDEISAVIQNLEDKEGYVILSKRSADYELRWKKAYDAFRQKKVLEAKVTNAVTGGLVVDVGGIRGFIPASQVVKKAEEPLKDLIGKNLPIKILEIDRRQGKVVLSHKLAAGEKKNFNADKLLSDLEVGQVRHGKVASIKKFGAFVDIGGIEGLIHITELSWKRVNHPSEVLKMGEELDVFVLGVDRENKKVALGLKELQPDPWVTATDLYKVGDVVKGKVARLAKFGAFIELEKGLEGLCHISELSVSPVQKPEDAVKIGQEVELKILRVIPDEQKIGLSIREVLIDREKKEIKEATPPKEERKVTIGDVLKEKEKQEAADQEEAY